MYPPHFLVIIDGTNTTQKARAQIHFTGTTKDECLVFDIPLVPPPQGTQILNAQKAIDIHVHVCVHAGTPAHSLHIPVPC